MKSAFLNDLSKRVDDATERARDLAGPLTEAQINWKPAEDRWSIAECLDHLLVTNALYLGNMEPAIQSGRSRGLTSDESVHRRVTIFGGFILRLLKDGRKKRTAAAPKMFVPASDLAPGMLDRFVKSQVRLKEALIDSDGLNLDRIKFGTPVSALLRASIGDALEILTIHEHRHLDQAHEVTESPGFPA